MEEPKSVKLDVDRIILQLLIPGLTAVLPFFLIFLNSFADVKTYFVNSEAMCTLVLFLLSIATGLVLEDLGSIIEAHWFDKLFKKRDAKFLNNWYDYLSLRSDETNKIVGFGFIKKTVIRLKFELSMGVAQIFLSIGLWLLNSQQHFLSSCPKQFIFFTVIPVIIAIYLIYEAYKSGQNLAEQRSEILKRRK